MQVMKNERKKKLEHNLNEIEIDGNMEVYKSLANKILVFFFPFFVLFRSYSIYIKTASTEKCCH